MTPLTFLPSILKPRERLLACGAESLELEELVAVIIRTGAGNRDVLGVSREVAAYLLSGAPSVEGLAAIHGIGAAKAAELMASLALARAVERRTQAAVLATPADIYAACADLIDFSQEHLAVFYLSVRNRALARDIISIGTATASLIHPREVFRPAIMRNASHIVLAHNHPSGDPSPSQADREATRTIARAGGQIGIELADHVICAKEGYRSLKIDAPELFYTGYSQ